MINLSTGLKGFLKIAVLALPFMVISYYHAFQYPPVMVDKSIVYDPLLKINSIAEYFDAVKGGEIVDLQPVRDFSLLLDIKIAKLLDFKNFPLLTNILLLLLCAFLIRKILNLQVGLVFSSLVTFIFLVHPAISQIFIEFVSRKHILSFLFFLISYYFYLKSRFQSKKHYLISILAHFLSLWSQPINAMTPLFFFFHDDWKKAFTKKSVLLGLPFVFSILVVGYLNVVYYQNENIKGEFIIDHKHNLIRLLEGINLYYRQILLPFNFVYRYDFKSLFNLVTMILNAVIMIYLLRRYKGLSLESKSLVKNGLILTGVIFCTLYIPKTNIINAVFQNYYILTPALAFVLICAGYKETLPMPNKQLAVCLLFIFAVYSTYINVTHNKNRTSTLNFMKYSAEIEENCYALQFVSVQSIANGDKKSFLKSSDKWLNRKCIVYLEGHMFARILINTFKIIYSEEFSYKEKEELFLKKFVAPYDFVLVMAILNLEMGNLEVAEEYIGKLGEFEEPSIFLNHTDYGLKFESMCKGKSNTNCDNFRKYWERTFRLESGVGYRKSI